MQVPEFAKSINVSRDTIYNILNGKTQISPSVKRNLFETYKNISREWFEQGIGEMFTWKESKEPKAKLKAISNVDDKDFIIEKYQKLISQQGKIIDMLTEDSTKYQNKIIELEKEILRLMSLNSTK